MLSTGATEWAAVDLASGALLRAHTVVDDDEPPLAVSWNLYDVVRVMIAPDDEPPDPARPEAVAVEPEPWRLGRLRRRRAWRLLRRLASPERPGGNLLSTHGPSIPYVDLDGASPSLMLIAVSPRSLEAFALSGGEAALAFSWSGTRHQLPVADEQLRSACIAAAPRSLSGGRLTAALGGKPSMLLIGLGPVRSGHAPKVVLTALAH